MFLIDAALVIFHNSPPRVVVSELKMDLACPESCFQAESAIDCRLELEYWSGTQFWENRLSIVSVVRQICQKELDDDLIGEFSRLGTLNLFTMVQGKAPGAHEIAYFSMQRLTWLQQFTP